MTAAVAAAVDDDGPVRHPGWARLTDRAPQLVLTSWRYLDQIALSLRPATVVAADTALRGLARPSRRRGRGPVRGGAARPHRDLQAVAGDCRDSPGAATGAQ